MMKRWFTLFLLTPLLAGCVTTRTVTMRTIPSDATLRIDGEDRGRGPITQDFDFHSPAETHRVVASRMGFKDASELLTQAFTKPEILLELRRETRTVNIVVEPVPAVISLDGKPISDGKVSVLTYEVELGVDAKNNPLTHVISADHVNYQSAKKVISRADTDLTYTLHMDAMKKNISVTTSPPGADLFIDQQKIGTSPLKEASVDFPVDPDTSEFLPRKLRAEKRGYDPVDIDINWDNGKPDYHVDLEAKSKQVRIITDPPGATVKIDGNEVPRDKDGMTTADLQFPPIDDSGTLKTHAVSITKKTADSEWVPANLTIGWENGRTDYRVPLKEILTRPVQQLAATMKRTDDGWEIDPQWTSTIAMKDTTEGPGRASPQKFTSLAKGTQIGAIAISPDGSQLLFTVFSGQTKNDFHSQMLLVKTDGSGAADIVSDGRSLDMMPSFSGGGDQIVFSSNRGGKRFNIWSMSANGSQGIKRLTVGDTNDVWPSIDSDPRPHLYYQAMIDTRPDARLYMTQVGTIFQMDLITQSGTQPRVSPRADAVAFCAVNDKTGKRDIYRVGVRGGVPENLTNSDSDNYDPNWSSDGSKIVFTSDRGVDADNRHNADLWMLDLTKPSDPPLQITSNASVDDSPVFDISGRGVFFRSNRGGDWQVWKIPVRN